MEYCAEIAVLESAFQLVAEKVAVRLADLPKESCAKAAGIVQVAVEEICTGLEHDNEPEDREQWSKKCHTLIMYRLITAKYNKKEQVPEGCVPRLTTLDALCHAIPVFSVHLYFEMVKLCGWQQLFVDSLYYLDPSIAVQILQEAITHSQLVPFAQSDTQLITTIMKNLVTSLLQSTSPTNTILQLLSSTVRKQTSFIQTVYPEVFNGMEEHQYLDNSHRLLTAFCNGEKDKMNNEFWCLFLKENANFLSYGLESYSQFWSDTNSLLSKETKEQTNSSSERHDSTVSRLSQVLFLWYAVHLTQGKSDWDKWFIYNVGVKRGNNENMEETAAYSLNYPLLDCLTLHCSKDQLLACIHKCLIHVQTKGQGNLEKSLKIKTDTKHVNAEVISSDSNSLLNSGKVQENDMVDIENSVKLDRNSEILEDKIDCVIKSADTQENNSTEISNSSSRLKKDTGETPVSSFNLEEFPDTLRMDEDIYIVRNIVIKSIVLLRMFLGTIPSINNDAVTEQCTQMTQWVLSGLRSKAKVCQDIAPDVAADINHGIATDVDLDVGSSEVLLGDTWEKDVSLPVLLWRISCDQPQSEACLEELLSDRCLKFWCMDSVYSVLENIKPALWTTKRVLKLFEIAEYVEGNSREITLKMKGLIVAVFSELSFPNQDQIIMVRYQQMPDGWSLYKADSSFNQKTTNVFNKLTADHSNQIQGEVLLLCLTDPLSIIRTAVEMCIRNEDQAISSAKVLQLLSRTCGCKHELYHPEMSLICSVVSQFVTTVKLTAKEEKNFLNFITLLIQKTSSGSVLVSPLEFLSTTIIPHTSMADFLNSSYPINFNFALSLLQITLSASCNKSCDWSTLELEPVVLVTVLAQILNECVVFWDGLNAVPQLEDEKYKVESGLSLPEKVTMREKTSKCLDTMCHLIGTRQITISDHQLNWIMQETSYLHWSVQYRLVAILEACGHTQTSVEWQGVIQECMAGLKDHLIYALMLISLDGKLANTLYPDCTLECNTVVTAIIQVWPNLLLCEFENVVVFLERLLSTGAIHITYRLGSPVLLPLSSMSDTELHHLLGLSQLLRDVVLTLTLCCHGDDTSHLQMLRHVVQGYVTLIKEKCETVSQFGESYQFILSQMFVHVCDVTEHLPSAASELTWVLLLHMVTKVMASCHSNKVKDSSHSNKVKEVANFDPSMFEAVNKLPQCEERDMIVKKLRK